METQYYIIIYITKKEKKYIIIIYINYKLIILKKKKIHFLLYNFDINIKIYNHLYYYNNFEADMNNRSIN